MSRWQLCRRTSFLVVRDKRDYIPAHYSVESTVDVVNTASALFSARINATQDNICSISSFHKHVKGRPGRFRNTWVLLLWWLRLWVKFVGVFTSVYLLYRFKTCSTNFLLPIAHQWSCVMFFINTRNVFSNFSETFTAIESFLPVYKARAAQFIITCRPYG